jgi:hypothetical protein
MIFDINPALATYTGDQDELYKHYLDIINTAWAKISQEYFDGLIKSIPRRVKACCEGLKLDLNLIELGHKLCTKSLEEERDGSSRIAEEVVRRAVAEREQAIWQGVDFHRVRNIRYTTRRI